MLRKDKPLATPAAQRAIKRIDLAFDTGVIQHKDYKPGAKENSEDQYKNRVLKDQMKDELEASIVSENLTPQQVDERVKEILAPHETVFVNNYRWFWGTGKWGEGVLGIGKDDPTKRQFSEKQYEDAIFSLNSKAKEEWKFTKKETAKGAFRQQTRPQDFLRKWQSPNKKATRDVSIIYLRWANNDRTAAKAMMIRDGWKAP